MDKEGIHNLGTLFYLAIEADCASCFRRFAEPEGDGEAGVHDWADKTAALAFQAGWRDVDGRPICSDCISHERVTN